MRVTDLIFCEVCNKELVLSHQCITENGFTSDENFTIKELVMIDESDNIEDYIDAPFAGIKQVIIINQYNQETTINPNQIERWKAAKEINPIG